MKHIMIEFNETHQHYISLLQDNINRMASNSSNCKTWLITLISAIFAISASKGDFVTYIWMAYIPTALFYFLDCFYLGVERRFRRIESRFVALVTQDSEALSHECQPHDIDKAVYKFSLPQGHEDKHNQFCQTIKAMWSWSTTPFYGCIFSIIFYVQHNFSFCICY